MIYGAQSKYRGKRERKVWGVDHLPEVRYFELDDKGTRDEPKRIHLLQESTDDSPRSIPSWRSSRIY